LRNSVAPITFGKDQRFRSIKPAGASVPFYDVKNKTLEDLDESKSGWGFGYTNRKVFTGKEFSHVPAPHEYYGETMTAFREKKNYKRCSFGLSYEYVKPRVEIENKKIHT
jgi:hypothetical protein